MSEENKTWDGRRVLLFNDYRKCYCHVIKLHRFNWNKNTQMSNMIKTIEYDKVSGGRFWIICLCFATDDSNHNMQHEVFLTCKSSKNWLFYSLRLANLFKKVIYSPGLDVMIKLKIQNVCSRQDSNSEPSIKFQKVCLHL